MPHQSTPVRLGSIFLCLVTLCSGCSRSHLKTSSSSPAANDWPIYRGNGQRTGFLPIHTPATLSPQWTFRTDGAVYASPLVASGLVLAASWDKKLHVLDPRSGKELRHISLGSSITSTPAMVDGRLFVGSEYPHGHLHAIDAASGQIIWQRPIQDVASSPVVVDGTVCIGAGDGMLYAVTADSGHIRWSFKTNHPITSSPAVHNGTVFVGSLDHCLYALRTSDGTMVWKKETRGPISSSPAVKGHSVYIGSSDSTLYALDTLRGELLWSFQTGGPIHTSAAVDDSLCCVGSDDGCLYALDQATGTCRWKWEGTSIIRSSPVLSHQAVFFGTHDGYLYVLDKSNGAMLWQFRTGGSINSSPALSSTGLYVGSDDGYIYAFGFGDIGQGRK